VSAHKQLNAKIDLRHLRCAVAAADYGSFRQAAEALKIQQSTLSRSILELERATSATLFKRSPGGVVVSTLGGDFVRMARSVLEQINEFGPSIITPLRVLAFRQQIHENRFSVRKREGIMMLMRGALLKRAKSGDAKACAPSRKPIAIISDVVRMRVRFRETDIPRHSALALRQSRG
jgi:Bacterial regulatory helix-turn-helix protein, lysR family